MMTTNFTKSLLVAAVFLTASGSAACRADGPFYGNGYCWGTGYACFLNAGYADQSMPYFSLHPPVYYSKPVPRTYGYSPFAYPPYVMTPEVASPTAGTIIENPYVSARPAVTIKPTRITTGPLRISNPYVNADDRASVAAK